MANKLTQVKTGGIADDAITDAKLPASSVGASELQDNAVGLAQMAGGTDGQVITYDASGDPVAVGPGTDGQVLTSTGAGSPPAFEAIPAQTPEGTAVLSTGESGGSKFLREDGDGTSSWQSVPAGGATINNATANELVTVASTTTQLDAEANLTFDGTSLVLTGDQMIKANDAAAKLKFKSGNVATDDEEFGSITWQSSADNVNASIAAHRATWANDGYLTFKTASSGTLSEQLRIDRFGNLDVARGNIEIKTSGKGIDFTANTDDENQTGAAVSAEVLNDYEVGTFTPTLDDSSATFGYGSQVGNYIKIGDLVHVELYIQLSSSSGTTANKVHIGGLPFHCQTANNAMRVGFTYGIADADSPRIGRVNGNQIECFKNYGHSSSLYNAAFDGGNERIAMSCTYLTS